MAEKAHKYLSARIGSQWYGIEVEKVIEVLHLVAYTEAPALQNDILGLTTVRDEVMPLIDLRRRFGLKDAQLKLDTPVVAIREAHGLIALVFVDADRVERTVVRCCAAATSCRYSQQFPYIRAVAANMRVRLLLLVDTARISEEMLAPLGVALIARVIYSETGSRFSDSVPEWLLECAPVFKIRSSSWAAPRQILLALRGFSAFVGIIRFFMVTRCFSSMTAILTPATLRRFGR